MTLDPGPLAALAGRSLHRAGVRRGRSKTAPPRCNTKAGAHDYHDRFSIQDAWGHNASYDDLYVLDGTGSRNNNFLGEQVVVATSPDGNGDDSDFTCSYADIDRRFPQGESR